MPTPRKTPARAADAAAKATRKAPVKAPARSPVKTRAPEPPVRPAAKGPTVTVPPAATVAKQHKEDKTRKPKLVRDSFTIPKVEYAAIDVLKKRAASMGAPSKKSELLRAGLKLLAAMDDASLKRAMEAVPTLKTGRPKQG